MKRARLPTRASGDAKSIANDLRRTVAETIARSVLGIADVPQREEPSERMKTYRCVFRDSDNKVLRLESTERADDETALQWGRHILSHQPQRKFCEIWQEGRFVARLDQVEEARVTETSSTVLWVSPDVDRWRIQREGHHSPENICDTREEAIEQASTMAARLVPCTIKIQNYRGAVTVLLEFPRRAHSSGRDGDASLS